MTTQDTARRRIVVGVDGSPTSRQALRWAARQAKLTGDALHVVVAWGAPPVYGGPLPPGIDFAEEARGEVEQELKETLDPGEAGRLRVDVVEGHPAKVLVDTAADAELLVVGCRGHGGFTGMLLGSVSQHVVAHARCPVVVVHDEEQPASS